MLYSLYKACVSRVVRATLAGGADFARWLAPPGAGRQRFARTTLRGKHLFPSKCIRHQANRRTTGRFAARVTAFLLSFCGALNAYAAPPGAIISNQGYVEFTNSANQQQIFNSNVVDLVTGASPSTSSIELTRIAAAGTGSYQETVGPAACFQGGAFVALGNPVLVGGTAIDPTLVYDVSQSAAYNLGEPLFIRLNDADQNLDYQALDYAVVTVSSASSGDSVIIRLTETGLNSGIFAGYVTTASGAANAGDCLLQTATNSTVRVNYIDPASGADSAQTSAVIDPVNVVFESRTGTPVSGSTIELVYAASGLPAVVYGNDGVSSFPSAITSGGTVSDSSGTSYVFGPGEYRFPVVPDGDYRLVLTPPTDYAAPSSASIGDLQNLPGAPYALGPASFGNAFRKSLGLSIDVDLPVDPQATALFLRKSTLTTVAAPGDFIRYELNIENASVSGLAPDVSIIDQLPSGVRYVSGSTTQNGASLPDPAIDMNNGTLTFDVGDLAIAETTQIFYVVEIVSGEKNQQLVNTATAFASGGLISNQSDAIVRLTEDLFRSTSTLIGRVVEGACADDTFTEDQGVANIRIYLEDGRYAVTDHGGRFHFEGLNPGTHVAQIDTDSVAEYFDIIGCDTAKAFTGRRDSQYVRLTRGSLTRADFYLRRKNAPEGTVDIELRNREMENTEQVAYALKVSGKGKVEISNLSVMVLLPSGVSYQPGSMSVDDVVVADPRIAGPSLVVSLPTQFGNWEQNILFHANIAASADGNLGTRAFAKFDSPIEPAQQTPTVETMMVREKALLENAGYVLNLNFPVLSAELTTEDQLNLSVLIEAWVGVRDISIQAIGHSDSSKVSAASKEIFADNYVLSEARARAAADFIANELSIAPDNIQVAGRGADDPIADNSTAEGRKKNRRVEMVLSGVRPKKPSFLEVTQATSGKRFAETKGAVPGADRDARKSSLDRSRDDVNSNRGAQAEPPIATLVPGVEMVLPAKGFAPALPVTRVSIKHDIGQTVSVLLNGQPVNTLNFDGIVTNAQKTFAISRWAGVDLRDGENEIRAIITNADGSRAKIIERLLHYAGAPVRGEIVKDMSVLVADGKTRPVIAVRLYDRQGQPTRAGTTGRFRVSDPYRSWWEVEDERKNDIVEIGVREPLYLVEEDGIALIELAPTTHSGEVTLLFGFENRRQQEMRTWLSAAQREWILVGFAEGSVGYNTLSENQTAAFAAGIEDGYYDDGRVAFFAKGSVKGEFLLTLAYDSTRSYEDAKDQFETVIDPNAYYGLYADQSEQRFEAASQRKLYVKIEKNQFNALFGDFNSGLSYTDLARYERHMNGVLSEYRGETLGYTAFASETDLSLVRDEIRGDGTSGLYRLSSAPIVGNSDRIRLEVRDRFDTGQVVSVRPLTRYLDYNIDILGGTLYFKQPVQSRDEFFNPIFIVAEYESLSDANEGIVAGGRGSAQFNDNKVELGLTHINDGQEGSGGDLTGIDMRWQINDETEFRAEIAKSSQDRLANSVSGSAHSASIEHQGEKVDVRAYIREVEDGFGLGLQSAAESGIRKVGVDGRAKFMEHYSLDGEATWQQNLVTDAIRTTARGRLRFENNGFNAIAGLIHASDAYADEETLTSNLAEVGVSQRVGDFTLRATSNFALSSSGADNVDFPNSLLLGTDYNVMQGVDVFAEFEDASGKDIDAQMSRVGVRASPWHRAQINSSFTNQSTEFGPRVFANLGVIQGFKLNDNWVLDFGVDSSKTVVKPDARVFDPDRELVSGSFNEDFVATFAGAAYNADLWSANGRIEVRSSDSEDRLGLLAGWYREPTMGHSMSAGIALLDSQMNSGNEMRSAAIKYGWAWRVAESRWSFLNRIDLIFDEKVLPTQTQKNQRLINNFNANRRFNEMSQLSMQYAFKYVKGMFDDLTISGYTDLIGLDYRHGFNSRWDTGIHSSVLHSYRSKTVDYGVGLDVGFNIRDNMWITLGYNILGFHDADFTEARYTAQGPFLTLAIKADQHTLRRIANNR